MPIKSVKMKLSKNKKSCFFLMSQGSFNPNIRFLGQKVCPVACTHRQTEWLLWAPFQGFRILQPISMDRPNMFISLFQLKRNNKRKYYLGTHIQKCSHDEQLTTTIMTVYFIKATMLMNFKTKKHSQELYNQGNNEYNLVYFLTSWVNYQKQKMPFQKQMYWTTMTLKCGPIFLLSALRPTED